MRRRPFFRICAYLVLAWAVIVWPAVYAQSTASGAVEKNALIIGNAKYKSSPLVNSVNDARAMAKALRELGFKVNLVLDGSLKQMSDALRVFGDSLNGGGVGLFYYAGHGMQIKGHNYLIPVDTDIRREDEVAYNALDVSQVLDKMESARNGTNIMVLDACRNNPFTRSFRSGSSGLAQMDAPVGTYISFATAPGKIANDGDGDNGLYTEHLLKTLREPGLKIEDVFKRVRVRVMADSNGQQVPWDNSSLTGDFYFLPPDGAAAPVMPPVQLAAPPPPTVPAVRAEPPGRVALAAPPRTLSAGPDSASGLVAEERFRQSLDIARRGDFAQALEGFEDAAKRGHAAAAYEAGMLLKAGRHPVRQELGQARSYFTRAAASHAAAAYELGVMWDRGIGGEKNCKEALSWLTRGAERGSVDAMVATADALMRACDGAKKPAEAARWLQQAAEKQSTAAQFSLGVLYFSGEGVAKDAVLARKWLGLAASRGHPSAKIYLERVP